MEEEFNRDDYFNLSELEDRLKGLFYPEPERLKGVYVTPKKLGGEMLWSKAEIEKWVAYATAPKEQV